MFEVCSEDQVTCKSSVFLFGLVYHSTVFLQYNVTTGKCEILIIYLETINIGLRDYLAAVVI